MKPILALASVLMISPSQGQPPVPPPVVLPSQGHEFMPGQSAPLPPGVVMPPDLRQNFGHEHAPEDDTAPPPVVKLALDIGPKFSALTDAGFRFLVPQPYMQVNHLRTKTVAVAMGDLEPLLAREVEIEFRQRDLVEPGPYYPPAPAVGPDTPVRRLSFITDVPEQKIEAVLKGLLPLLGIDAAKPEAWVKNGMWEVTPGLQIQGTVTGGESRIFLSRGKDGPFGLQVSLSWGEPENPPGFDPSNQRQSRPRASGNQRIGPRPEH